MYIYVCMWYVYVCIYIYIYICVCVWYIYIYDIWYMIYIYVIYIYIYIYMWYIYIYIYIYVTNKAHGLRSQSHLLEIVWRKKRQQQVLSIFGPCIWSPSPAWCLRSPASRSSSPSKTWESQKAWMSWTFSNFTHWILGMITLMIPYEKRHSGAREIHHLEVTTFAGRPRSASGWGWWRRVGTTPCCCRRHRPRRAVRSGGGRPHPQAIWSIWSQAIQCQNTTKIKRRAEPWELGKSSWLSQGSKHQVVCFAPSARSPFTLPWAWLSTGLHWNWQCVNGENYDPPLEMGYPIFGQMHKMIWPTWKRGWSLPCRNRS